MDCGDHDPGTFIPYFQAMHSYKPGSICWLKAKGDLAGGVEGIAELPGGCYNHPAVLLWTEGVGAKATVFLVSAYGFS